MRTPSIALSLFAFPILLSTAVIAGDWTNWRGPGIDGTVESGNYAVEWSDDKNLAWSISLPSRSGSTPIVLGDKIFVSCTIDEKNGLLCLNRQGETVWQQTLGEAKAGKHKKASASNPSPVTDGEYVFVYYKNGDFAALNLEGEIIWQKNLQAAYGEDTLWWDLGTSPVLTKDHVVIACMQSPPSPSYLAAFDKETGEEVWKVDRELGAPEEAAQSYSTPVVTEYEGQEQIVVLGADFVTCHSAQNGKELWRVGTLNPDQERFFRSIASPVITNGIVIAPYARGATLTAIRMGGSGNVTQSHVLWTKKDFSSDVPTPAAIDGKVFLCTDKGEVGCIDAESGEELWKVETPKNRLKFSSSPILAGNRLYLVREDAVTFVVDTDRKKIIATNELGSDEFIVSTPVFTDGQILIRTFDHLYCIGDAAKKVVKN
ncbi:PQQ-binding-like beta-propeller repeat protein [Thalassoglobus sp. JC818]|uniref:outer membrane protein assembly factor BamB family protein n=1 Tax=Thalassoglobus sp. JC818 TaxID=3232136 RepID=UPI003459932D